MTLLEAVAHRLENLREVLRGRKLDTLLLVNDEKRGWENVFYLSGFKGTAAVLAVSQTSAVLLVDSRYIEQARAQSAVETRQIRPGRGQLETAGRILEELQSKRVAFDGDSLSVAAYLALAVGKFEWADFSKELASLRRRKDEWEISRVVRASEIAARAYLNALSGARPGMTELEFSKLIELEIARLGGEGVWHGGDMIVASGTRSSMPHAAASGKAFERGEHVTVDFGAIFGAYMCDITRNFSLGPVRETEFSDIHEVLIEAHAASAALLRPGVRASDVHEAARGIIARAGYGDCFGHAAGHGLGLEIHESPVLSPRSVEILREGDVVTIEPGIYLPGRGGLRLEDDYLIVPGGSRRLTAALPQTFVRLEG